MPNKNSITEKSIAELMLRSEVASQQFGNKTTVVSVRLPNGFVITESSSCVDPANYSKVKGEDICFKRIRERLWELEGYRLQCELHSKK